MKNNGCKRRVYIVILAAILVWTPLGHTQESNEPSTRIAGERSQEQPQASISSGNAVQKTEDSAYVRLFGGEVVNLNANRQTGAEPDGERGTPEAAHQLVFGATASGGYTWTNEAAADQFGTDSEFGAPMLSSYVGLVGNMRRGGYAIQYSPTFTVQRYQEQRSTTLETVHEIAAGFEGALSRRLNWQLTLIGSYGSQFARFNSPQVVNSVSPTTSPDARSSLLTNFGMNQAQSEVGVHLEWQKSRTQTIQIGVSGEYFATITEDDRTPGDHAISGGLSVAFAQSLTNNVTLNPYATVTRLFNTPACTTYGGGLELGIETRRGTQISIGGGPQGASRGCGNPSFNAHARVSSPLRPTSELYISADRQFSTVFGEKGRWSDSVGVGISRTFNRTTLNVDAGYIRAENGVGSSATNGYFFSGNYNQQLSRTFSIGFGFRQAQFITPVGEITRAIGVSVGWHPRPVPLTTQ